MYSSEHQDIALETKAVIAPIVPTFATFSISDNRESSLDVQSSHPGWEMDNSRSSHFNAGAQYQYQIRNVCCIVSARNLTGLIPESIRHHRLQELVDVHVRDNNLSSSTKGVMLTFNRYLTYRQAILYN